MRASVIWSLIFVAVVLVAAGCSGTGKKRASLADSCDRQVKQIQEEANTSTIKESKSSEDASAQEHLVECAGQPVPATSSDAKGDGAMMGDGGGADATGDASATKLTDAMLATERDTFSKTCSSCHTLADAKTTGTFGPNLDTLDLTADDITSQLKNGGGGMPAGLLTGDDADAMASYILQVQQKK